VVSLLYGAVSFAVGAFGGLIWVLSPEKGSEVPTPAPSAQ
jgi:hypothetical protein